MDSALLDPIADRLDTVATALDGGPTGSDPLGGGATLRGLAASLRDGGAALVGRDLLAAFPPETLVPEPVRGPWDRIAGALTTLRDVLVFLPIFVTWESLHGALSSWNADSGVAFLTYWRPSLTTAAVWIAALIMLVIVMTAAVIPWASRRADAENPAVRLRAELGALLARATLELAVPVGDAAAGAAVEQLSQRLRAAADQVLAMAETLGKDVRQALGTEGGVGLGDVVARLDTMLTGLDGMVGAWATTATALRETAGTLRTPADVVRELVQLRERVAAEEERLRTQTQALLRQIQEFTESQAVEARTVTGLTEAVRENAAQTNQVLQHFGGRVEQLGEAVGRLREELDEIVGGRVP